MDHRQLFRSLAIAALLGGGWIGGASRAAHQPVAIFHAFNQRFEDVEAFVCALAEQGYSHVQISPAQKSNPGGEWWKRYQPLDHGVIEGLGSENDLKCLSETAHSCGMKVIADVVFNHMANLDGGEDFENLDKYPGLSSDDFHTVATNPGQRPCEVGDNNGYGDGDRQAELTCWLGGLPDLRFTDSVRSIHKAHIQTLLDLGIDGFRFDAAKHIPADVLKDYIDFINEQSAGQSWNYLEVIEDRDTKAEDYNWIAAVTDFRIYNSMKGMFSLAGDLRALPADAVADNRSVTFGQNHDTMRSLNDHAINPYDDISDSYLATSYVLAREGGTPLIFNDDNLNAAFIPHGVAFRRIMQARGLEGKEVSESVLKVINRDTIAVIERGKEGFVVVNKGLAPLDQPVLDLTLTNLEGCYRELRNNFTVAIERRGGSKFVTRWGHWNRGGMRIEGRDALFFVREPFSLCL